MRYLIRISAPLFVLGCLLLSSGCHSVKKQSTASWTPLFEGTGSHHRAVTTKSKQAQRYFDQGLVFAYAFNHDEAIRSFEEAARLDPNCAMNWWGIALSNGPHINNPAMTPERSTRAWEALQKAVQLKSGASATEQSLIDALSRRYASPTPSDRKPLDHAYAEAMAELWLNHPKDADIATLYAEALMDLQPWDLWMREGEPKGNTKQIVAALEDAMGLNPRHPGALHLYIHAIEASGNPAKAIPAADRLRKLVPAASHLLHMPSHIDVLTGRWTEAVESNLRAIESDEAYRKISPRQEFFRIYMAHNHQMLAFAAMMEGRSKLAIDAARAIFPNVPEEYAQRETVAIEPAFLIRYDALIRFGKWDEILSETAPPKYLLTTTALWRFSRGIAFAAKGDVDSADKEYAEFQKAKANVPQDRVLAANPAHLILQIADHVIVGEIAYRRGKINDAVASLEKAIALEDSLAYMEPPEWTMPVRHTLGAILLEAGRFAEAEKVYRADLAKWPENGWSLLGLSKSLRARNSNDEAVQVEKRFKKAWAHADIKINTTCLCVR